MRKVIAVFLALLLLTGCKVYETKPGNSVTAAQTQTETLLPPDGSVHPLLWRATDAAGHTLYLFGTIHAGDSRSEQALAQLEPVLSACDALAVEFDVVAFESDFAAQFEMLSKLTYQDGTTVRDHVSQAQYDWLKQTLEDAGLYNALMDNYVLAMWEMSAESALLEKYSTLDTQNAMDRLLIQRAYALEKPVYDVESAAFQYGLLTTFPDELYRIQIDELSSIGGEAYGVELNLLYWAWITGDLASIDVLLEKDSGQAGLTPEQRAIVEDYHRQMLDERNLGMRDKALGYLQSGETVFFAVGTAHVLGEAGLVQLLTDAGCTVEPVPWQNGYQTGE